MRRLLLTFFGLSLAAFAQTNSLTVYEVDNASQTNRPITFGRFFKAAEIIAGNCPRPSVGGTPVATGHWQADIKNAWDSDGSVRFAIISIDRETLTASGSAAITFTSQAADSNCNGTGALTQAQMTGFNSGNWDAQISFAATGSTTVTVSAKTMLGLTDPASNTFNDCGNDYWLKGPVVTAVVIQDCTVNATYDFGWTWNGSTMSSPVTGNSTTASLHPWFIAYFYPDSNRVMVESVIGNTGSNRRQDQAGILYFKGGTGPTTAWESDTSGAGLASCTVAGSASGAFTCFGWSQEFRKTFWSNADGTYTNSGPGQIRIDHNFAYLKSTLALPNYDSSVTFSTSFNDSTNGATSWSQWTTGDKGEIGGYGGMYELPKGYANNDEGFLISREDLLYLYNMDSCGTANSECAKAWQMLTGQSGAIDTSLTASNVTGGGGAWNNMGNVPFHVYEKRGGGNSFYCGNMADKDALSNINLATCTGAVGNAIGKPLSRYAFPSSQWGAGFNAITGVTNAGSVINSGWSIGDTSHWLDFYYVPYLLTGSPWHLMNLQQAASMAHYQSGNGFTSANNGARFFGFINDTNSSQIRAHAWGMLALGRAAFMSPDGTVEATMYKSFLNSNLEIREGASGITGTSLTPSDTSCSAATCTFNPAAANRWNWGRGLYISDCAVSGTCSTIPMTLYGSFSGQCPPAGGYSATVDATVADSGLQAWMESMNVIVYSHLRELGLANISNVQAQMSKRILEASLDQTYNPYLFGQNGLPSHGVGVACGPSLRSLNPFISSWATLLTGSKNKAGTTGTCPYVGGTGLSLQCQSTFDDVSSSIYYSGNTDYKSFSCNSHGYPQQLRAALSFLQEFNISTSNANCSGGTCTAAAGWTFAANYIPSHTGAAVTNSTACPAASGAIPARAVLIKLAIIPRPVIANDVCNITTIGANSPPFVQPVAVSGAAVSIGVTCTPGQGSINSIQSNYDTPPVTAGMPSSASSPLAGAFDSTLLSNGTHTLSCAGADTGGGTGVCPPISISVNNASPASNSAIKNGSLSGATVR